MASTPAVGLMSIEAPKQPKKKRPALAAVTSVPLIDNRLLPKPLQVRPGEPCSITVNISGLPPPVVRWQIGRRRVKDSTKYQVTSDGQIGHTLVIARATEDLEQGVWVVASNEQGEDCCRIEVNIDRQTNEGEMSGRHSRRPPSASTPEMKQKTSILRKKKTRRVSETQSAVSLDAWGAGSGAESSKRPPSVDDVNTDLDRSLVATPSDMNQSLDSGAIHSGRIRKRTKQKPSRFSSTDAIYSGAPLSVMPGRQDSYSSVATIDVVGPSTDGRPEDSEFLRTGAETHQVEERTTTAKKKKSSVRKKKAGSRSSLASNSGADASNGKNTEAKTTEETVKEQPVMTTEPEEKVPSAKELDGLSYPLETDDGKLLWELFGMRLNLLCKRLLTEIQSNMNAEHKVKTETFEAAVDGDDFSEPEQPQPLIQPQQQQQHHSEHQSPQQQEPHHEQSQPNQQQKETSVDDEEEIIRRMVESRQIPITDLDDFDRDEEEPPLLVRAKRNETSVDDDLKETHPTLENGKECETAPVQEPGEDIPDAEIHTRPATKETEEDTMPKANDTVPSIAIYDVQGSMVEPSATESQKRTLIKGKPPLGILENTQKEAEEKESHGRKQETGKPDVKKKPEVKVPETKDQSRKEAEKHGPETKEPELKESSKIEQFRKEPENKESEKIEPLTKQPEKKESEIKEPFRKELETKEPEKKKQEKTEAEKKEPDQKEPTRKPVIQEPVVPQKNKPEETEPLITEPVKKEPFRTDPEKKESFRKEPLIKEPVRKEPDNKEHEKMEPHRKEPFRKDQEKKEQEKKEQEKKESFRKEPPIKEPFRKEPENKNTEKIEPAKKEPFRKDQEKKEPEKTDSFRKEPPIKEPVKKEPEKKEPEKLEPAKTAPFRKDQETKEPEKKESFRKEAPVKEPVRKEHEKKEHENAEPSIKEPATKEPGRKETVLEEKRKNEYGDEQSGIKPSVQMTQSPTDKEKNDASRIQEKPPTGKKPLTSPEDDLRTTKAVVHPGYRPLPAPRKLSSSGGGSESDDRVLKEKVGGVEGTEDVPPPVPWAPGGLERVRRRRDDNVSYSWQRERREDSDGPFQDNKSMTDNNTPVALTTYILHSGAKSRPSPTAANKGLEDKPKDKDDSPSTQASMTPVSATKPNDVVTRRSLLSATVPVVPERAGRKTTDRANDEESSSQRQRSHSAGRVERQDSDRRLVVVDIDFDDQQGNSRADLYKTGSSNLYRSASGDLSTVQGADDLQRRPPVPKPRQSVSLKPARSEEFLSTNPSASDCPGRKNKAYGSGKFMRTAKSVESLNATGHDSSFVSRMGRRTMSQEWQVVTVTTTTTEEIVVVGQAKDTTDSNRRTDFASKEVLNKANKGDKAGDLGERPTDASKDSKKQTDEHPHPKQVRGETVKDAQIMTEDVAETRHEEAVTAKDKVPEETANSTYITSATIFLKSPASPTKHRDEAVKSPRNLDTASKLPNRPRLSSQDISTQTDEDPTEDETQIQTTPSTDKSTRSQQEKESYTGNREKSVDSEDKTICSAVVYEYGEIISFYLDTASGLNVEPSALNVERVRLEPGKPVTALVTDNRSTIKLSPAADPSKNGDKGSEKDNMRTTALPDRNPKTDHRTYKEYDDRRSRSTTTSSGSEDSTFGSEHVESFVALRFSNAGRVSAKAMEANPQHHRLSASSDVFSFPELPQMTAMNAAIDNQSSMSTIRPLSEISSSVSTNRPSSEISSSMSTNRPSSEISSSMSTNRPSSEISSSMSTNRPSSEISSSMSTNRPSSEISSSMSTNRPSSEISSSMSTNRSSSEISSSMSTNRPSSEIHSSMSTNRPSSEIHSSMSTNRPSSEISSSMSTNRPSLEISSITSANRPSSEISSSREERIGGTDYALIQQDELQLTSLQTAADESPDYDQSDEESRQSSVSSAPSCDTVIRVAIKEPSEEPNKTPSDYVQSALPTSLVRSDPKQGEDTDDDEIAELDSAITTHQFEIRSDQDRRVQEEEELGAVGGIAAAPKEDESDGACHRDEAQCNEAWPGRPPPDRSRAEPIDDVMNEKAFVQMSLSSIGTIIFLAVAAIIFHFLNNIVGDDME